MIVIFYKEIKMDTNKRLEELLELSEYPRFNLAQLPTPIHQLNNFSKLLDGPELWIKRDDLTGLVGGGNKTRKLEFLVGDAIENGYDTLVTIGAIQSNHTRQTAAAAAKSGLKCSLLHYGWTKDAGPNYRKVGNILLSSIMGADLYVDNTERPIEDQGPLAEFGEFLEKKGQKPYLITGGASENTLGSLGYVVCAAEIVKQTMEKGISLDYLVHCTGSSSTQAGMVAGFKALGSNIHVIGVADDGDTVEQALANVRGAIQVFIDSLVEDNEPVSADQPEHDIITTTQVDAPDHFQFV
jgi:1-aminocyclopropane-1-carboxylate deaminase/D-cysteine desulfhydrase-like pyridoxal-dependent ACC family enzyme